MPLEITMLICDLNLVFNLYFSILYNFSYIHNKAFSHVRDFFPQKFYVKSLFLSLFSYFIIVPILISINRITQPQRLPP